MYVGGIVDAFGISFHCLLLENLREEGNVVGNSVGSAPGCRSIVELPNTISGGKFLEHVGDAGGVMYIIVHIAMTDCLKRQA